MFEQWQRDQEEKSEFAKRFGMFIASFINPEAVKRIESAVHFESKEEDYKESLKLVDQSNYSTPAQRRARKRKFKIASKP